MQSSICNITNLTPHTLVTCGVTRYQPSGIHVTNLSNVLFFSEKNKVFKKKEQDVFIGRTRAFKNLTCCFFHNGIYMPKRLTFPSDLSATPQTPCLSAFRLKDIPHEMFQPENILQENQIPKNRRNTGPAEGFQSPAEGFPSPILQPECRRTGRLREG